MPIYPDMTWLLNCIVYPAAARKASPKPNGALTRMTRDPDRSPFAFVMYPEATPFLEAYRAAEELRTVGIEPGLVVANFVIPPEQATTPFARSRRAMQEKYLAEIRQRFNVPLVEIPLLPTEVEGIALLLTRILTRPVTELVSVARAIGRGELSVKAQRHMDDEIGELASAFNTMTDDLTRSRAELLHRLRELGTLNATAAAVSGGLSLTAMLQAALDKVLDVMSLRAGWIFLAGDEAEPPLRLAVNAGLSAAFAAEGSERELGRCICAQVLDEGRPRIVHDIRRECPRLSAEVITAEGLACHASVPLIARERVVGVLNVASAWAREFTTEEIALLDSVGRQIGVAVENARLWEEVKRKEMLRGQLLSQVITAQEAERKRIARELHDDAGQLLTTLLVGLRTLEQTAALPDAAQHRLTDLKQLAKHIFDEIHRLAVELRPNALDQLGLVKAVESCLCDFGQRVGVKTDFEVSGLDGLRLPGEVEIAIYRVTQEALSNVAKHAAASHVAVLLEKRNGSVVVVIEDDGQGFDAEAVFRSNGSARPHLGLFGMQERAELLGGRLTIESERGKGTTVFVEIPLNDG